MPHEKKKKLISKDFMRAKRNCPSSSLCMLFSQKKESYTQKGLIFQRFHLGTWDLKTNDFMG
jgi:hypothetical protein